MARDGGGWANRALEGAYNKGYDAGKAGQERLSPYRDKRKHDGRVTFARAFKAAWLSGYDHAALEVGIVPIQIMRD